MRDQKHRGSSAMVSTPQVQQNHGGTPAMVSTPQVQQNHGGTPAVVSTPQVEQNYGGTPAVVSTPQVEQNESSPTPGCSPAMVSSPQLEQNHGKFPAVVNSAEVEQDRGAAQCPPIVVSNRQEKEDRGASQCSPAVVSNGQETEDRGAPQCSPAMVSNRQQKEDRGATQWTVAAVVSNGQETEDRGAPQCSPAVVSNGQEKEDRGAPQCSPAVVSNGQEKEDRGAPQRTPVSNGQEKEDRGAPQCSPVSSAQVKEDRAAPQFSPLSVGCSPSVTGNLQEEQNIRASRCCPVLVGCSPAVVSCSQAEHIEVLQSVDVTPVAAFDSETSGYISSGQFWTLLQKHGSELDPHKLDVLLALAHSNAEGKICYQDVLNLLCNKRSNSFRRAILQGNRHLCSKTLMEESSLDLTQRLIRHVAYETLPREIDRKWFYDNYTGCPPPWFMITVTIVEVAIFVYYGLLLDRFVLQVTHSQYLKKNPLVYHPQLRAQMWRYLSYMFMHAGIEHLGMNVALQLLVGVPLEMVHGALKVGFVYVAGVLAGSLAVSVTDMTAPLVGSSGGVYAIVSAHLANIVM
ncbi:uncharacterized protein [Eleutherodactylus coqui]